MSDRAETVRSVLIGAGELARDDRVTAVDQLSGGWSRHSFVALARTAGGAERRYVVRAKPEGTLLDTDLATEYEVYAALQGSGVAIPPVFGFEQEATDAFGGPFFVMGHMAGGTPNVFRAGDRRALELNWEHGGTIARDMVTNLARIHAQPAQSLPASLPRLGYQDVLARWRRVYEDKALVRDPVLEAAYQWAADREPPDERLGLVHGDYRIGNVLEQDGRVTAVLDWELSYQGDVRFDLGYARMARFAGKHLRERSSLLGSFADEGWFLEEYERQTGTSLDREVVRSFEMLGVMLNFATQMTGIWMHAKGRTDDFRMAWARFAGPGLRQDAARLMAWS